MKKSTKENSKTTSSSNGKDNDSEEYEYFTPQEIEALDKYKEFTDGYFDDEELDELKGIPPEEFTDKQNQMLEDVFFTLREQDMAGWIRSLQLRNIELPDDIRDQALLIISERRQNTLENYNKNH